MFRKIKHGTIKAGSVGFIPMEYVNEGQDKELFAQHPGARRIYKKQSLLEWTICPIPANPNALAASYRKSLEKRFEAAAIEACAADDLTNEQARKVLERLEDIDSLLKGE